MPTFDLVTAGDAFDDYVFAGLPRLPRAGEELKTPTLVRAPGGGAVITAHGRFRVVRKECSQAAAIPGQIGLRDASRPALPKGGDEMIFLGLLAFQI